MPTPIWLDFLARFGAGSRQNERPARDKVPRAGRSFSGGAGHHPRPGTASGLPPQRRVQITRTPQLAPVEEYRAGMPAVDG